GPFGREQQRGRSDRHDRRHQARMITAQVESLTERLEELKAFFPKHWDVLALNKDVVPLDPQYAKYLRRDALGLVLFVSLRKDGDLIGYFVGFVAPGLHYQTCLTLQM